MIKEQIVSAFWEFGITCSPQEVTQVGRASWADRLPNPQFSMTSSLDCVESTQAVVAELAERGVAGRPCRTANAYCLTRDRKHFSAQDWVTGQVSSTRLRNEVEIFQLGRSLQLAHTPVSSDYGQRIPATSHVAISRLRASITDSEFSHLQAGQRENSALELLRQQRAWLNRREVDMALRHYLAKDGIAHGDVHPGNIVLHKGSVVLIDWGGLRSNGQWYETLRTVLWSVGDEPSEGGIDEKLLRAFALGYHSERVVDMDWAACVRDFVTILMLDGSLLHRSCSQSELEFGVRRFRLADFLQLNERSVVKQLEAAFRTNGRHPSLP